MLPLVHLEEIDKVVGDDGVWFNTEVLIAVGEQTGLHYHLDVPSTVVYLAGDRQPRPWDGVSLRTDVESGTDSAGRGFLVLTQGAWSCQPSALSTPSYWSWGMAP